MGHAHFLITIDVYADKTKLVIDCLEELEPFIKSVIPDTKNSQNNYTNLDEIIKMENYVMDIKK